MLRLIQLVLAGATVGLLTAFIAAVVLMLYRRRCAQVITVQWQPRAKPWLKGLFAGECVYCSRLRVLSV